MRVVTKMPTTVTRSIRMQRDTIQGMRRAGRVSPLLLVVVLGLAAVVVILFMGQKGPTETASRFMDALARGDYETLAKTSVVSGKTEAQLVDEWKFTTQVAGKHYSFRWSITSSRVVDDKTGDVKLQVERNYGPGSYEENYGLPMLKDANGDWKVDAGGISSEMYPGLPRPGKA